LLFYREMLTNNPNIFKTLNENEVVRIQLKRDEGNNLPEEDANIYSNINRIDLKYSKKLSDNEKKILLMLIEDSTS